MEHGQINSIPKTRTKAEVCGQIHSFLMSVRCWAFPTDFHKMLGFPTAQKKRLTSIDEPCKDVGIL